MHSASGEVYYPNIYFREVSIALHTHFENVITSIDIVDKVDLDQINHLSGEKQQFLKLSFHNINDLMTVRRVLRGIVSKNQKKQKSEAAYSLEVHNIYIYIYI